MNIWILPAHSSTFPALAVVGSPSTLTQVSRVGRLAAIYGGILACVSLAAGDVGIDEGIVWLLSKAA